MRLMIRIRKAEFLPSTCLMAHTLFQCRYISGLIILWLFAKVTNTTDFNNDGLTSGHLKGIVRDALGAQ